MSEGDKQTSPEPEFSGAERGEVPGDDRIIGVAFRWSLAVMVLAALVIGGIAIYRSRSETSAPVGETPVVPAASQPIEVRAPVVAFKDVTEAAGIRFRHTSGATGKKLLPETMGAGCAFFDYDRDEDPDILLVNSDYWPDDPRRATAPRPTPALYRNDRGSFVDVTQEVGLGFSVYGQGVAVGDYDGDGWIDVFITTIHENLLLRNNHGKLSDVTAAAGVAGGAHAWSTSAAFFDADNDGDLDLFVCNYLDWSAEKDQSNDYRLTGIGRAYAPPMDFAGVQPYFYRNRGDGVFDEVAEAVGLQVLSAATKVAAAKALAVLPCDFDRDGLMDLFVANDTVANFLFHNKKDGVFEEIGHMAGVAFDGLGRATGAMGADMAFFRGDDAVAIAVGNFANEPSSLYVAEGKDLIFSDEANTEGIGTISRQMLTFGLFFFDYDLDGRIDLFQTNGHLEEEINKVQPSQHYEQPSQLFWNCGPEHSTCFIPVESPTSGDLTRPVVGRGAAYADYDGDGDLDILVAQTNRPALLFRNDQATGNNWIRLRLEGTGKNRHAIGALVEVMAGGRLGRQQVMPARSYLSQVEPVLTFGLGAATAAENVRIHWPGRPQPQDIGSIPAGTYRVVKEPQ